MSAANYFALARERYQIRQRRVAGQAPPWTTDPVMQQYRFTNVHREHDRTTEWFRDNVRSKLSGLRVVEATLIFRWLNRVETGEIIKDMLLEGWITEEARRRLQDVKPLVTGAFMIKTPTGMSKLDGLLYAIEKALPKLPALVATWGASIQQATEDLQQIHGLGPFLAYEITTDLRWTSVLNQAADIETWANFGPGATHGMGRIFFDDAWHWKRSRPEHQVEMVARMHQLLQMSKDSIYWPTEWPKWEAREVEHWACEYDKHCRGTEGQHLKRRFAGF